MKITFLGAAKTVTGSCFLWRRRLLNSCRLRHVSGIFKNNALNEEEFLLMLKNLIIFFLPMRI